jgi:hypothetical protein
MSSFGGWPAGQSTRYRCGRMPGQPVQRHASLPGISVQHRRASNRSCMTHDYHKLPRSCMTHDYHKLPWSCMTHDYHKLPTKSCIRKVLDMTLATQLLHCVHVLSRMLERAVHTVVLGVAPRTSLPNEVAAGIAQRLPGGSPILRSIGCAATVTSSYRAELGLLMTSLVNVVPSLTCASASVSLLCTVPGRLIAHGCTRKQCS